MTISTGPTPARTDLPAAPTTPGVSTAAVRRTGALLASGSALWAGTVFVIGLAPTDTLHITIGELSGLPFQFGLFALVFVQLRTRATGLSRAAAAMLRVEFVLLALAASWTVLHGAVPAFRDDLWLAVLDAFWPLSMLGMAIIGIKLAFAGRWQGPARWWPAFAESWVLMTMPAVILLGDGGRWFAGGHLLVGYGALGLVLMLKPHLTGARD